MLFFSALSSFDLAAKWLCECVRERERYMKDSIPPTIAFQLSESV